MTLTTRFWRLSTMIVTLGLLLAVGAIGRGAIANTVDSSGEQAPHADVATVSGRGFGIGGVFTRHEADPSVTDSRDFVRLTTTPLLKVPAAKSQRFIVRFSGSSSCVGEGTTTCVIRVKVGNTVIPANSNVIFDMTDGGAPGFNTFEQHAVEVFSGCLGPGNYPVSIDYGAFVPPSQPTSQFIFDSWSLVVEQVNNCS